MVCITVVDHEGTEQQGKWNGKVYSSKIDGKPELARIYLDNKEVHVDKDILEKASGISKKETDYASAKKRINDINFYSDVEKMIMLVRLLEDPFCRHMVSRARPDMNHIVLEVGEKQVKIKSLDELFALDENIIKNIMSRDDKIIDMKQYMPTIEEE